MTARLQEDHWMGRVCEGDCFGQGKILDSFGPSLETCRFAGAKQNSGYPRCSERTMIVGEKTYHIVMGTNYQGGKHA